MSFTLADRVKETTNTTGTGTLTLAGAVSGFQSFAVIGTGSTTHYAIVSGTDWEVGQGTYTASGTTLSRDTVFASSNAGALINVAAGAEVFITYAATTSLTENNLHTELEFAGTATDGVIIDYVHPFARVSVGTGDGVRIFTGGVASSQIAEFKSNGDTDISGVLSVGVGALIGGATNPQIAAAGSSSTYIQAYIRNDTAGAGSSADLIGYPDNGTDTSGWVDVGMTSSVFSDAAFSVTGPNESYLFGSAPSGASKTGNLVYATDSTGTANSHQWYVGGFNQAKSAYKMQLTSSGFELKTALLPNGSAGTANQLLASAGTGAIPTWTDIKTVNGTSLIGSGNVTVSASAAGTTGEVQYNNAGALAGAANIEVENGFLRLPDTGANPATPAASGLDLFSRTRGGRVLPAWIGPSGLDTTIQPALFGNSTYMWVPGTGTTLAINWGCSFTARNSGTSAAQATPARASTNSMTSMVRATFGTGTTATGASGIQSASTVAWRGNAAGLGGFFFFARFGIETLAADMRAFVGLSANNAAMAADSSTWANTVGIGKDTADSVWQVVTRSATTLTKTSTGATITAGQILDLHMYAPPNGSSITVRLADAVSGTVYVNNVAFTTNIPAATTFMYMQAHCQSVTGTTAKLLALNRLYCENDL
jgi:hypothetical protein